MIIKVNGEKTEFEEDLSLIQLLLNYNISIETQGVAIALNESIIPRLRWVDVILNDGDEIEIVWASQGG